MNNIEAYMVTNDSVTVVSGGKPFVVKKGQPNFLALRDTLLKAVKSNASSDWSDVTAHLKAGTSLEKWAKGRFKVENDVILFDGLPIVPELQARISEMAANGEDPTRLFKFWERLQLNPSKNSVDQLYRFLNNAGIPITSDGFILAYKGVRTDYKDCHSGTIDNTPGRTISMPRNQISDNPDYGCHVGLHVGSREYANSFGPLLLVVKVDPQHVVCVPNDHSYQKMRTCEYQVIGLDNGSHLPSTSIDEKELPKAPDPVAAPKTKRSKGFQKLDSMDESQLMNCKYDTLRAYASRGLHIVGVSKITGGKWSLVQAIRKARGH